MFNSFCSSAALKTILIVLFCSLATSLQAKVHKVDAGVDAQDALQEALIVAEPGDVIELSAGDFLLSDGLSLDVDQVTVRGAGADKTILNFKQQQGAGEGLLVTSDDVTLRDFSVRDTKGDGIKSKGADRIIYYNINVQWTGGPSEANGAYGIYPVSSSHVLIDSSRVQGASDAGIYVGQSQNIIVRNSTVEFNVAGIEIENCYDADVYNNIATHNTGGILVFDLPNLPQQRGRNVRLFDNVIKQNDEPNFAPKGNIVASVPTGTGVMVMANNNVEVFNNVLEDNGTSNVLIVAYPNEFDDENYLPLGDNIWLSDNEHGKAGFAPDLEGLDALLPAFGGALPPVLWDGLSVKAGSIAVHDKVAVLNLGLTYQGQAMDQAKPGLVDLASEVVKKRLPDIQLPEGMTARIK